MRKLHHLPLDSGCRKIRMLLREKKLEFELHAEKVWERREAFLALNPAGEVPVLVEDDGTSITGGAQVISEYLEEAYPEQSLLGDNPLCRAEVRRLISWFDDKFRREVTANLVEEKMLKRFLGLGEPNSQAIRAGHANIHYHLEYISWLTDRRTWLAGDDFSLADITAASHISSLDYIGDVPWNEHQGAKDWYARIKSRPCMRGVLTDLIPGVPPPKHYADLDF
ncbi:glutathione S-transferase [Kiloniella spongiae]|uniref:Glutathione S-transferase n=1 Tax=Kiloniella spongiae TaxID=1489064 RepID=A0A0H2MJY8_9PROT|nr:glutathione S-transferase family protein [Kiloniella spongiae]KLN62481.1 glutathione S-transferase [Kiloniella spongiae]